MDKNNYNDKKYEKVIKSLKELPRIKTSDNFEYNLMTRINNKNFGALAEKRSYSLFWRLSPIAGAVLSAVILFFIFSDQSNEIENPLMKLPPAITEGTVAPPDDLGAIESPVENSPERREISPSSVENSAPRSTGDENEELYRVVVRSNDVISKEKIKLNLNNDNNVDLDYYLNGGARTANRNRRTMLVGGTEPFEFDGFYIGEQTDPKILEMIKNRIDSLRQIQADSLKRLQSSEK